ncbi:MAG: Stf0 family sulfotransferase [Actinomycetota bacterium]
MRSPESSKTPTTTLLAIASVHRTGSTLLCSILRATGMAGMPMEYLNIHTRNFTNFRAENSLPRLNLKGLAVGAVRKATGRTAWRNIDYFSDSSWRDYLRRAAAINTTPNGVFGIKMHFNQYDEHMLRRGLDASFWGAPIKWVRITRENQVRQAISLVRAEQSNQWNSNMTAVREPNYDEQAIVNAIHTIDAANQNWDRYFAANSIVPLQVSYEQLTKNMDDTVRRIMNHIDTPIDTVPAPQTKRQSDGASAQWETRFLGARPEFAPRAATL